MMVLYVVGGSNDDLRGLVPRVLEYLFAQMARLVS